MYVSNLLHFLDQSGNIQKDVPENIFQMAQSLVAFVNYATDFDERIQILPSCFVTIKNQRCNDRVMPMLSLDDHNIYWSCESCGSDGVITNWQGTFWDLSENDEYH